MNRQNLDMSSAENERIKAELDALQQKYCLVSALLKAQASENEAFEQFKKIFNEDFMAFANKESSLADEAEAVQRLQALEKRLEQIVAFPHMFAKRSVAIGGGFSSGKSAFVNSFITIKQPRIELPVGIQPVTAIPSYVMASQDVSIKGYSHNGATVAIEPAFYAQLSHDFIDAFDFNLKELMPSIAVEVPLQAGFEHICLLDTPGYDPAGGQTSGDEATATEFLKNQNALIWLIDVANGTVPQTDLDFIEGLGLNGHPFYVVLNKADLKPASELKSILAEVQETLEDAELVPQGISVYSATDHREYLSADLSLPKFFRQQNQPVENLGAGLKAEMESIFAKYEKAIADDEQAASGLAGKLKELNLDVNQLGVDADSKKLDDLQERIDKIKRAQQKNFAPIKDELRQVKEKMFQAAERCLLSLVDDKKSKDQIRKVWRPQKQSKRPSQASRQRQSSGKPTSQKTPLRSAKDVAMEKPTYANDRYALHQAAKDNNYKEAAALLRRGAEPNAKDKNGYAPLHWAAEHNAHETARVLLSQGAEPNTKDKNGYAPLHWAAMHDAHKTTEVLLRQGAEPNAKDKNGYAPLHWAAEHNAHETARALLRQGAKPNAKDKNGRTPLHWAAMHDALEVTKVLFNRRGPSKVAVNPRDHKGWTPLDYAEKNMAQRTTELLLNCGGKRAASKKKAKAADKPNPAFMGPLQPDAALGAIVGNKPLPRTQITKKVWVYIKRHGLQDNINARMINADDKLRAVVGGAKKVSMFDLTKHVSKHVK